MARTLAELLNRRQSQNGDGWAAHDEYLEAKCPLLHALLSLTMHEGSPRKPCSLILFAEDGRYKVSLNDKDAGLVAFTTVSTAEEFFEGLEAKLDADKIEWRSSRTRPVR